MCQFLNAAQKRQRKAARKLIQQPWNYAAAFRSDAFYSLRMAHSSAHGRFGVARAHRTRRDLEDASGFDHNARVEGFYLP